MPAPKTRVASIVAALAVSPVFAGLARAQVPEGSAVIGTYTEANSPGTPGLFVVPLAGGPVTPVTGLPAELNTDGGGAYFQGAWSVSHRPTDGAVVVGTITNVNLLSRGAVKLFVLHLNGTAVDTARTQEIVLGTATTTAVAWHALLPDGRILVIAGQAGPAPLPFGPMAGRFWAIVDVSGAAPSFTLLPNPPPVFNQGLSTVTADPTGQYAYYVASNSFHFAPTTATLVRLDLATGQACRIANWLGQSSFGIVCDDDGTVYVSSTDPTLVEHYVHTVRPDGCNAAPVTTVQSSRPILAWGLDLDRRSGRFAATSLSNRAGFSGPQLGAVSLIEPATGAVTVIASPPSGGWGTIGNEGVAVNNVIESYGAPSDGQNRYWFDNFPNPGGQPTVGNQTFSLTARSAPGAAVWSGILLSPLRGSMQVFGADILVDLNTSIGLTLATAPNVPVPLPIPNVPSLLGNVINVQTVHFESGALALDASRGLTLTIQ